MINSPAESAPFAGECALAPPTPYEASGVQKSKTYSDSRFSADVLKAAVDAAKVMAAVSEPLGTSLSIEHPDSRWSFDTFEEFIADYRRLDGYAWASFDFPGIELRMHCIKGDTEISVTARDRASIESLFDVFEREADKAKRPPLPLAPKPKNPPISIFIGHGGESIAWRELKDHLQDKHGHQVTAYETGARAGHSIRDILEEMIAASSFALLVLTGEDEQKDSKFRARQNVIHEAGLFQGRLGFPRAILLLEHGVEQFSNVQGVQYIPFSKGNIKETFGEVLATIRREFPQGKN